MTETEPLLVSSVAELRDHLVGVASRIFESSVRCTSDDDDVDLESVDMHPSLFLRGTEEHHEVRLKLDLTRADVSIVLDMGFQFKWDVPLQYADVQVLPVHFARDVALDYAIAHMRPIVEGMARTVEVPPLILPLEFAHAWSLKFEAPSADQEP